MRAGGSKSIYWNERVVGEDILPVAGFAGKHVMEVCDENGIIIGRALTVMWDKTGEQIRGQVCFSSVEKEWPNKAILHIDWFPDGRARQLNEVPDGFKIYNVQVQERKIKERTPHTFIADKITAYTL
jgi:hypothetical protein